MEAAHVHSEACGFIEAVEGVPCSHVHDENCGGLTEIGSALCTLTEGCTLPDGHEGGCELPMMMRGTPRSSTPIPGKGYIFNPDDGKLTVSSNEGTINWRTDTNIAADFFASRKAIRSVEFETSVTEIKDNAFKDCINLTGNLNLPEGLQSIGGSAFYNCTSLTAFSVADGNPYFSTEDGVLYDKNRTTLLNYALGKTDTTFDVPDGVTTIGSKAFDNADNLTSVTFPDSLGIVGEGAFAGCGSLKNVTFPKDLTAIGVEAFSRCEALASVNFPSSLQSIGDSAFASCIALKSVIFPDSLQSIGNYAFTFCDSLNALTFQTDVPPKISTYAFYQGSSSGTITYPAGASDYNEEWRNGIELSGWTLTPAYRLTVANGTDETNAALYPVNARVQIKADTAPTGKAFDKWTTSDGGTFTDPGSPYTTFIMPDANVTVTATYKDISVPVYTVNLNTVGGSSIYPMAIAAGGAIPRPDDPLRDGYLFSGWYRDEAGTQPWDFTRDTVQGNLTLYAKWEPIAGYQVTFDTAGGSQVPAAAGLKAGELVPMPEEPVRNSMNSQAGIRRI